MGILFYKSIILIWAYCNRKRKRVKDKYCDIGGQALIEGVMMRGKETVAISVRKPDGDIETKVESAGRLFSHSVFKLPLIRGMVALIKSMIIGVKALTYSAEFYVEEDEKYAPSKFEKWLEKTFKDKADNIIIGFSILVAFAMAILMFAVLPALLTGLLKHIIFSSGVLSIIEGLIKMIMFIGYITLISRMRDIKRVFEYHGAEHKTIHCFEAGKPLTPENATIFKRLHPRCGTSFLLFVMVISIGVFSLITWTSIATRILLKVLLLPLVAGISFEVLKVSAKYDNIFMRALSTPGMWLQKLTTREPDLKQLAVAIAAMEAVLEKEPVNNCEVAGCDSVVVGR